MALSQWMNIPGGSSGVFSMNPGAAGQFQTISVWCKIPEQPHTNDKLVLLEWTVK